MTSITPIAVIHREAEAAAKQALCPAQACRWPQETPQAQEWMRCYRQVRAQIAEPDAEGSAS